MHHAIQAVLKQAVRPGTRARFNSSTFNQLRPELSRLHGVPVQRSVTIEGVVFECCDEHLEAGFVSLLDTDGQPYQIIPVDIPTSSADL